jgi:hypothetical protein
MDTRRWNGRATLSATNILAVGIWRAHQGVADTGGTPDQRAMARWAVGRFSESGLGVPTLEIQFHRDRAGCDGRLGMHRDGTAHICGIHVNDLSRRDLLHEMSHAWVDEHVSEVREARFLRLRQLETWNDHDVEWEERGTEHAAEIIGWAVAGQPDGKGMPSIPMNDPPQLAAAFELLTGHPLPD